MTTTAERSEKRRRAAPLPPAPPAIPEDLLLSDVLPRLPVKSLARFKCVCRSWRAAVETDPSLARRHLVLSRAAAAPPMSMLVVPRKEFHYHDDDDEYISFYRLILGTKTAAAAGVELMFKKAWPEGILRQDGAVVPTHCDGLVAVAGGGDRVLVCNPATRELVALPPGSRDVLDDDARPVALGYDPLRNVYVVARCFYRKYDVHEDPVSGAVVSVDYDVGHETFTLGGGGCSGWEVTADPPHAVAPARPPVCTAEAFYWCTAARVSPSKLLRFGLRDRTFEVVSFPTGLEFVHGADHMTELAGMPCLAWQATDTAFDFWVAAGGGGDDGPRMAWSLRCRVDFGDASVGCDAMFVVDAAGDEMVIAVDHREL